MSHDENVSKGSEPGAPIDFAVTQQAVNTAVDHWLRWLAGWKPSRQRTRARICRKCTGSPIRQAAGFDDGVPHQVTHALITRMHRFIDKIVADYTAQHLPALHAELEGDSVWRGSHFDPTADLPPEADSDEIDPLPENDSQPFLFTLKEFTAEGSADQALPRPPLSAAEKEQIKCEIEVADQVAASVGQQLCFALSEHRERIRRAVEHFVEPQVQELLSELSRHLEAPSS